MQRDRAAPTMVVASLPPGPRRVSIPQAAFCPGRQTIAAACHTSWRASTLLPFPVDDSASTSARPQGIRCRPRGGHARSRRRWPRRSKGQSYVVTTGQVPVVLHSHHRYQRFPELKTLSIRTSISCSSEHQAMPVAATRAHTKHPGQHHAAQGARALPERGNAV